MHGMSLASALPPQPGQPLSRSAAALSVHGGYAALTGLPTDLEPMVCGLRVGGLVEVHGLSPEAEDEFGLGPSFSVNGSLGQIVSYTGGEPGSFFVCLTCGVSGYIKPENVRSVEGLAQPGQGGGESSFDMLLAPRTEASVLSAEMKRCIVEKGFCVLRTCQSAHLLESTMARMQVLSADGHLKRLAEEVEPGYLGLGCVGKIAWMDFKMAGPLSRALQEDDLLSSADSNLSYLAQLLQPDATDLFDDPLDERTPGLLCMGMSYEEEQDYPCPEADDRILGVFLTTWRRTLVRVIHFLGPGTARVVLEGRAESPKAQKISNLQSSITISAEPNTILIFRPDVYDYSCLMPEGSLMMITNFLSPAPMMTLLQMEGDISWLNNKVEGPPPPPGENRLHVVNAVCRLPGNWDSQWDAYSGLTAASDTIIEIPFTRWDVSIYYTDQVDNFLEWQTTTKHQSFCEGVEMFDNKHFEISNAESQSMDPVQRILLETGAQSLAMIGLTKKVSNRKSTHSGCAVGNDKLDWGSVPKTMAVGAAIGGTSTVLAIIANRFNFVFNLKGPSFVCDTACSASLTSTHCAKMMMLERVFDPLEWFLTMGAHLCLSGGPFIGCSQSHMSSPKGRCFTFNSSADGYLRGEGISGFMMKYAALADGESEATLRATQTGQDGRSASLTAPNGPSQEEMIRRCFNEAKMTPPESTVWECHGTGTSLGDPIEVGAVRKVQVRMQRLEPLMLGSAKTNIGHLEGGAAMGGMVKCILQVKHCRCCPTLHVRCLNPHLEHAAFDASYLLEGIAFAYPQGHSQVSSFGFGGTNGHAIFWGKSKEICQDMEKIYLRRLRARPIPEVRPMGKNPDDWEADFPDTRALPKNCKFRIAMGPDDPADMPIRWEVADYGLDEECADQDASFWVIGNFNNWALPPRSSSGYIIAEDDHPGCMSEGEVPGLHVTYLEVPDSGILEFRFLKYGDPQQALAPMTPFCSRRGGNIDGPSPNLENFWVVSGPPGVQVRIEFFSRRGKCSVTWLIERD